MSVVPDTPWTQLDKVLTDFVDRHEIPDCEAAYEYTKATRRAAGECERCGRKLPKHWGGCSPLSDVNFKKQKYAKESM